MERQPYHYGLASHASSTSCAVGCFAASVRRAAPLHQPRTKRYLVQCSSEIGEDAAAADSMQWLWDRKASLTKERVKSRDVRARKYAEHMLNTTVFHHANRSLGQNYLINEAVLETIIAKTGVQPGDTVLEVARIHNAQHTHQSAAHLHQVGPGTGNLTKHLLLKGARVLAIEKDAELAKKLIEEFSSRSIAPAALRIATSDVLRVNLRNAVSCCAALDPEGPAVSPITIPKDGDAPPMSSRITVVANLPFYITKDFLRTLLPMGDVVSSVFLLLQEEVAERLIEGGPGDRDYRAANVELLLYARPRYLFTISRTSFFPPPKVVQWMCLWERR